MTMLKNLKTEWLKIRNYRTFWVLLILFVICTIGVNYIGFQTKTHVQVNGMSLLIGSPFDFPDVWQSITYTSSYLLFIIGLIMLILVCNEFNFRTHRQNVIDGIGRFDFALTKILVALKLSVLATIMTALIAVFIGITGHTSFSLDNAHYLLYFFLQAFTYSMFGVLFGFLFKKTGIAIALYFVYIFFIKNIVFYYFQFHKSNAGNYFPVESSDDLIHFPVLQNLSRQVFTPANQTVLIALTLVYITVFCFVIMKKFTSEDL